MTIGIIVAMSREFAAIERLLSNITATTSGVFRFKTGEIGENKIVLAESGIGKVNAAIGAQELIKVFNPDVVISTGVAGGCDPEKANVMDIVVGCSMTYHDVDCGSENELGQVQGLPAVYKGDERLIKAALSVASEDIKIAPGLIVTGDRFVSKPEDLKAILANFPDAIAIDMESTAIAQVCHIYKKPFLSFRIVSDIPGSPNHYAEYFDFWDKLADKSFAATEKFFLTNFRF